jgi:hypothetical protein
MWMARGAAIGTMSSEEPLLDRGGGARGLFEATPIC